MSGATAEVVDELFTPGCPQCAVKHLCAALVDAAALDSGVTPPDGGVAPRRGDPPPFEAGVALATAFINFVEAAEGYASHFDYAVGLLERAEELAVAFSAEAQAAFAARVRGVRVAATASGDPGDAARAVVAAFGFPNAAHRMYAHWNEARRELPGFPWDDVASGAEGATGVADVALKCVSMIREEYFDFGKPEDPEKGGDDTMATKKTAKPAPKACKGGKCATPKKGCKK